MKEFDLLEVKDDETRQDIWKLLGSLFGNHEAMKVIDVEQAIQIRNIIVKRLPDDHELITRLETEVVFMMFNLAKYKAQRLYDPRKSALETRHSEMKQASE